MGIAEFSIWTREAGAGGLSIAVEGPSKAEIAFEDRKDGSSGVSYIVQEPGERRNGKIFSNVFCFAPLLFSLYVCCGARPVGVFCDFLTQALSTCRRL